MTKVISKGFCSFCQSEIAKNTMTQHLKHCKQRAAAIAAEAENSTEAQKTRLLYIIVEGHYNPQYWIHLEAPVSDTMEDLDWFLRSIWLEGFDHLSAFKVGTTNYSSRPDDYVTIFETDVEGEGDDIIEKALQELEEEEEQRNTVNEVEAIIDSLPPFYAELLPPNMLTELKRFQSIDDLLDFLRQEVKEAKKSFAAAASNLPLTEEQQNRLQLRTVLPSLIEELDDRDMYTPLGRALKVGQKFSYEYDFGSTTELKLRVVSEREGVVRDQKNTIVILARNVPPGISCCVCGKPAMRIAAGYYSAEDDAYCSSKCAKEKDENYEEMLPVINSPRVGVI